MDKRILKFIVVVSAVVFISGCETLVERPARDGIAPSSRVRPGMSRAEVMAVMGDKVVVGYEVVEGSETFVPIEVENPYRTEKFLKNGKQYTVLYYFTGVKEADGEVTDDELKPFVFEYDLLVGSGWDALKRIRDPR